MKKKKILFSLEDFENHFSKEFIKRLKINYDITIITSTKKSFFLDNSINIINYNISFLDNIINKICILLSSVHLSKKQKIYAQFQIEQTNNIIKKKLLKFKFFLSKINLLPKMNSLYSFFYFFFPTDDKFFSKFDYFIYDFRLFEKHNNCKRLIYTAIKYKKIKTVSWVYSWDNIFTFSTITSSDLFIVWCKYIKKLMYKLHKIEKNKILINSPVQFEYLNSLKKSKKKTKDQYILFACSYGGHESNIKDYVVDDIKMIEYITKY